MAILLVPLFWSSIISAHQVVTISNNVTAETLSYRYCGISYHPFFTLTINKQLLKQGSQKTFEIENSHIILQYKCSFLGGIYKSTRTLTYELPKKTEPINVTFSWNDPDHLIVRAGSHTLKPLLQK